MRIPCAKCNYPHDSTVTPFMHDTITKDNSTAIDRETFPGFVMLVNLKISTFKCEKCGLTNRVLMTWSTMEEEKATDVLDNDNS